MPIFTSAIQYYLLLLVRAIRKEKGRESTDVLKRKMKLFVCNRAMDQKKPKGIHKKGYSEQESRIKGLNTI